MKKKFALENLDCAHCAAKMEEGIRKLPAVESASVNFLSQKMVIDAAEGTDWDALMTEIVKVCRKIEPDCRIIL